MSSFLDGQLPQSPYPGETFETEKETKIYKKNKRERLKEI